MLFRRPRKQSPAARLLLEVYTVGPCWVGRGEPTPAGNALATRAPQPSCDELWSQAWRPRQVHARMRNENGCAAVVLACGRPRWRNERSVYGTRCNVFTRFFSPKTRLAPLDLEPLRISKHDRAMSSSAPEHAYYIISYIIS